MSEPTFTDALLLVMRLWRDEINRKESHDHLARLQVYADVAQALTDLNVSAHKKAADDGNRQRQQ